MTNPTLRRWADLAERTAATYVQAVLGLLLATQAHMLSLGAVRAAAIAAIPAALAAIKAAFALGLGPGGTASLLPAPAAPVPAAAPVPDVPAADQPAGA